MNLVEGWRKEKKTRWKIVAYQQDIRFRRRQWKDKKETKDLLLNKMNNNVSQSILKPFRAKRSFYNFELLPDFFCDKLDGSSLGESYKKLNYTQWNGHMKLTTTWWCQLAYYCKTGYHLWDLNLNIVRGITSLHIIVYFFLCNMLFKLFKNNRQFMLF